MALATIVRGDLVCLNCGRFLGAVEGEEGRQLRLISVEGRAPQAPVKQVGRGEIRCGRCGGRALIEDLRKERGAA